MPSIINKINVTYIEDNFLQDILILEEKKAEMCQERVNDLKTGCIDDMVKTLEIATAFVNGEGIRWCPECGTELELSHKDPWVNGVFCPCCNRTFSWQHWIHFGEKWTWDEENTGLLSFHGDDVEASIPGHCSKICSYAFSNSSALTVHIPNSVKAIEPYAFCNASNLEQVDLPLGLHRIEEGTFMGCDKLKYVTIPKSVKYIGKNAFAGCVSLRKVFLPESLIMIDAGAFSGSGLVDLILPGVILIGSKAFEACMDLHTVTLKAKHIGVSSFAECKNLRNVKLHEGLMTIGEEAFKNCSSLSYFHVPTSVCEFGNQAFSGITKLTVHIPKALEEHVHNYRAYRVTIGKERNYIFDRSAKLHYYEGSV